MSAGLEATVSFNGAWNDRIEITCDNGPDRMVKIKVNAQTVSQIVVLHGDDFDRIIAEYARFNAHAAATGESP
jgi:hypothetical protein